MTSIARQAAHGVAWNMAFGVSSRVLQLVGTLILTHVVAPEAYGDVITASIVVALLCPPVLLAALRRRRIRRAVEVA